MKCPHCGKQISDYAITCPNCGGNAKGQATEEVKSKAKVIVEKTDSQTNKMLLIGAGVAFLVPLFYPIIFLVPLIGRELDCIVYSVVLLVVLLIGVKYNAFKVVIKNKAFYIVSAIVAIADFLFQDFLFNLKYGSDIVKQIKVIMPSIWTIFNVAKTIHIVVLIVGIALLIAFVVRRKKTENK